MLAKGKVGYFIYNLVVSIITLFVVPYFYIRNLYLRRPMPHYFFNLSKSDVERLKGKAVIWVQAASVGETLVANSIIREIKNLLPDYQIVCTTMTSTGYSVARQKLGDLALVTYFPLDLPVFIKRFVTRIHPELFIIVESEFWPNAIKYSKESGAKLALVNGRIGVHSFNNYLRFSRFLKVVFHQIDLFAMQSVEDANRLGMIGAPLEKIMVTGNSKFDQDYPSISQEQLNSFREQYYFKKEQRVFTAASTHRGEEEIIIEAFLRLLKDEPYYLILAPRYPERADEVGALLEQYQLTFTRRSGQESTKNCQVLLMDTFGELGLAYAIADVIVVGGSLIKMKGTAGHNVLEAAVQGKPVLYGPYMDNFLESKRLLEEADAGFKVHDAAELCKTIKEITFDQTLYQKRASSAKMAVLANRGAAKNTASLTADLLNKGVIREE